MSEPLHPTKAKLLEAAFDVIRARGYSATTVDDICAAAGVTKGGFFHHFRSKQDLAVAAAEHWTQVTGELFRTAPYHTPEDPLDRVLAYVDFRRSLLQGDIPKFTCLVGTIVQEAYDTDPAIRDACARSIFRHVETLEADIADAMENCGVADDWTAEGLALHTQAVLQGAFVLAKAANSPAVAVESVDHLRRYIELLFRKE